MALLSGEVETSCGGQCACRWCSCSGWLCYPGKLKHQRNDVHARNAIRFRMALLSGEVETTTSTASPAPPNPFRMALLSGEVETGAFSRTQNRRHLACSGWLCYPGKLKPRPAQRCRDGGRHRSGWLCYPGKLKHPLAHVPLAPLRRFRMALLSGEVETGAAMRWARSGRNVPDGFAIRGS